MSQSQGADARGERGLRAVLPGQSSQRHIPAATADQIPPQVSEWLPELLDDLLPTTAGSLRTLAAHYDDAYGTNILETRRPGPFVYEYLCEVHDVDALATHYASALTEYALKYDPADYDDLPERHQAIHDDLERFLTQFGTGAGPFDRGIDALDRGPLAIHRQDPTPSTIWVTLDAQAWDDVSDQRTAATSLSALAALGEAFDVALVVSSPRLLRELRRHHREWVEDHLSDLDFAEHGIPARQASSSEAIDERETRTTALTALADLDEQGGRVRLLDALPADGSREQRMLIDDPAVDLAESTVSNYLSDLAAAGLVAVDAEGRTHNRVSLTPAGEIVQKYIADDYILRSPQQSTFDRDFAPTPHDATSRVYRAQQTREGGREPPATAEEWLADTGNADENGYVTWLDGPTDILDSYGMHERQAAAQRTPGVTLVDHDIATFDDGRVAYLSCFEEDVQAIVQWGGPLPTLARCTATLLSDHAFSRLLTPEALGDEFDALYQEFEEDVNRILVKGAQIGWLGEEEREYEGFKDRYRTVRNLCLERLPDVLGSDETDEYSDLFRDLHGLFASTTQLYHAADLDVTIQLRVPDTDQLQRSDARYASFLDFFGHTAPKHTVYESAVGVHSGYREVLEDREQKLDSRLDYDLDADAPHAECTVSWVVSGPNATDFESDIYQAIQRRAATIRENVRDGDETAPLLEIPVVTGTTYPTIKAVIDRIAGRKGFLTDRSELLEQGVRDRQPIERCIRVLIACFSSAEQPGEVSPFDVAEVLLHCSSSSRVEPLSVANVAYGLAQVPANRLFPTIAPSATKIVQVLLLADGPIGRAEICERAGISTSSYDRHISELAALAIVEPHSVEGQRKWTAHLELWWAPGSSATTPHGDEPSPLAGSTSWLRGVLEIVAETTDPDLPNDLWAWPPDIPAVLRQAVGLEPWLPFLAAQFGLADPSELTGNQRGEEMIAPVGNDLPENSIASPPEKQRTAIIGIEPEASASRQTSLSTAVADQ